MTNLSRRSLFAGLGALIAAPAIVRAASLMPVRAIVPVRRNTYLTLSDITSLNDITRKWVMEFRENNSFFIANIDRQWWDEYLSFYASVSPRIGAQFRIRLPHPEWSDEQVYPIVHDA